MRHLLCILSALSLLASRADAQDVTPVVKYGKWALLAGAIGMNYMAARAHNDADAAFDVIEATCAVDQARCATGPDGSYADPAMEDLYQTTLQHDQEARRWLIGGETALVGSAVMFIWELTRPKDRPDDIPFEPEVRSLRAGGTGLGLRVAF